MHNRRLEPRMLCADLVDIQWHDQNGRTRRAIANLEDISISGACLQLDSAIPPKTQLRIRYPKGELRGRVCYCVYRDSGYFLGIEFDSGSRWSQHRFRPEHLLDPRRLIARAISRIVRQVGPENPTIQ